MQEEQNNTWGITCHSTWGLEVSILAGTVKVSKPVIYEDSEEERMRNTWILMFLNQKKKT